MIRIGWVTSSSSLRASSGRQSPAAASVSFMAGLPFRRSDLQKPFPANFLKKKRMAALRLTFLVRPDHPSCTLFEPSPGVGAEGVFAPRRTRERTGSMRRKNRLAARILIGCLIAAGLALPAIRWTASAGAAGLGPVANGALPGPFPLFP